jgi:adenylate cyclase
MAEEGYQPKLAAVLSADVVGYSRLMADDEVATIRTLSAHRDQISRQVRENDGRVVDFSGDNMLAEFLSARKALDCALQIQNALARSNAALEGNRRMHWRIGIDLGEILVDKGLIYGDGVNIASRLEGLAEPGGICISGVVHTQVHHKLDVGFVDLGKKALKNIAAPVRVYRVIRQGAETIPAAVQAPTEPEMSLPVPAKPSLAVLPFANLSADSKQDYFSDGLTMDIMTALVKIPGLFLISEISMFSYKSQAPSIRELGRRLGVSHVLDGGVRKAGDRIRITARLLETANGRQVWAERFDRKIDDIFAVQDEITEKIVEAMDIKLVTGEMAPKIRKNLRNPEALEYYYRGWEALFGSTRDDIQDALQMFEETMRLEPESSFGYALAAWAHWWSVDQGLSADIPRSLQRAGEMARKAREREDFTGLSHLVMAQIHLYHHEHDKALAAAEKAVLARPSCDISYVAKANILNYLGRPAEAIDLAQYAIRLAPVYPPFFPQILAAAFFGSGRYEDAIAAARDVLKRDPDNLGAFLILASANAALDRPAEAARAAAEVRRIKPDFAVGKYAETQPYKDPDKRAQLSDLLQKAGLN